MRTAPNRGVRAQAQARSPSVCHSGQRDESPHFRANFGFPSSRIRNDARLAGTVPTPRKD